MLIQHMCMQQNPSPRDACSMGTLILHCLPHQPEFDSTEIPPEERGGEKTQKESFPSLGVSSCADDMGTKNMCVAPSHNRVGGSRHATTNKQTQKRITIEGIPADSQSGTWPHHPQRSFLAASGTPFPAECTIRATARQERNIRPRLPGHLEQEQRKTTGGRFREQNFLIVVHIDLTPLESPWQWQWFEGHLHRIGLLNFLYSIHCLHCIQRQAVSTTCTKKRGRECRPLSGNPCSTNIYSIQHSTTIPQQHRVCSHSLLTKERKGKHPG